MEYYNLNRILPHKCTYNILLGQRATGKSYAVKEECVKEAFLGMGDLIYLRRWHLELKQDDVTDYFADCPVEQITGGQYQTIEVYRSRIYLATRDEEGKTTRGRCIGRTAALTDAGHLKSVIQRGQYKNVVFEEFCTNEGYLRNEPSILMQFIATCFGVQHTGRVWLIGNTVSRHNPYFFEWSLKSLAKMKPGDIDIYRYTNDDASEVTIAVEFCSSLNVDTGMFIGESHANITTGVWETQSQPQVPDSFGKFKVVYTMGIIYQDFHFMMKVIQNSNKERLLLCTNANENESSRRVVSDRIDGDAMHTTKLIPLTTGDRVIMQLIKRGKLVFANNLVGTDFNSILRNVSI